MFVDGKVALVTGGAFGIGFCIAKELLQNGLKGVTLVDIDETKGKDAVDALSLKYGQEKIIFVKADVVSKREFEDAMKKTVETFGHFDILINNAGIMNDTVWEKEIDINIKGLVNGCILGLEEYLPKHNGGTEPVIVNIASTAGLMPLYFLPVYTSTKHAVVGLGKALAMRENCGMQKVRLMTLCPGPTLTTLIDNLENRAFTPRLTETVKHFFEQYPEEITQKPESVATAMVKILEDGGNGSVWVIKAGELYEIEVPSFTDYKILRQL